MQPIRPRYSDDDEIEELEKKRKEAMATRTVLEVSCWDQKNEVWGPFTFPPYPMAISLGTEVTLLTLNVWYSDKWQRPRTHALVNLLRQHRADFVCLQEVGDFVRQEILADDWVRKFYCAADASGDEILADRDFAPFVLINRDIALVALKDVRLVEFSKSITQRCAIVVYLAELAVINVHLIIPPNGH